MQEVTVIIPHGCCPGMPGKFVLKQDSRGNVILPPKTTGTCTGCRKEDIGTAFGIESKDGEMASILNMFGCPFCGKGRMTMRLLIKHPRAMEGKDNSSAADVKIEFLVQGEGGNDDRISCDNCNMELVVSETGSVLLSCPWQED